MAVYNGDRFLGEAIESIFGQTFSDFEFVVVDDGSTDGSLELLERFARRDQRLRLVSRDNRGLAASLNQAIGLARGVLIARMDADDVSLPERFERQVAFLDAHPEVAVVGTAAQLLGPAGPVQCYLRPPTTPTEVLRGLLEDNGPVHASVMFHKRAFDEVGGYREVYPAAQDRDLWLRIAERHRLANLPQALLLYRLHRDQISVTRLERQVMSRLVAVRGYERRLRGEADPIVDLQAVDRETVLGLGIHPDELRAAVLRTQLSQAAQLRSFGLLEGARRIVAELVAHEGLSRDLRAEREWVLGGIAAANGESARAAVNIGHALLLRPALVRRLVPAIRRRLSRLPGEY
jgi:glycosyltransferase involved in cell wall biosynthesis